MKTFAFAWACVLAALVLSACGTDGTIKADSENPITIQRTSDTTFFVADNAGYRPDLNLRRTCETIGMVVVDVSPSPGYEDALNVVCGPRS